MKRFLEWLETTFPRHSAAVEEDEHDTSVGVTTKENVKDENSDSDRTPTVPTLTILQESSFEIIESTGYDPYNSGSFETPKSRLRK
jgi:hypothetical protein